MKRLALALLVTVALPVAAQDNSGLDRLDTRDDLRGWEAIGRVDVRNRGFCTGTLIASDLVLTAAHCVIDDEGAPVPAEAITFRAGLSDGTALAESAVAETVVHPDYRNVTPSPPEIIRIDVALLRLATAVPTGQIAPFTVGVPGEGDEVSVVSYAEGREEALSWQRVCRVLGRRDSLIAVDCDVTYGSSGAPVLDRSSGYRAQIVSIISAGAEVGGRRAALGMELPGMVSYLKAALRGGRATSTANSGAPASGTVGKRLVPGQENDTGARFISP